MLSTKNLVFKEQLARKLVDWYIGPYIIKEVVSTNVVKLWLSMLMRIHLVVNVSQIVWYREQVGGQKKEEVKPVEVEEVKEWEVERILNKQKVGEVIKYLVLWLPSHIFNIISLYFVGSRVWCNDWLYHKLY